jgi:uncharacterized membrane protein
MGAASPVEGPIDGRGRLDSIDAVRGAIMVFMLLDHMRDFTHSGAFRFDALDPARTTPVLYATRWITHLCAPGFVFLAGLGMGLQRLRGKPIPELARFLWTRGLWLVFLELVVLRGFIWFNFHPSMLAQLQVIWAIGLGMIVLAALVRLPPRALLVIGGAIVLGHNLLDAFPATPWRGPGSPVPSALGKLWIVVRQGGVFPIADFPSPIVLAQYPPLPWFGVLALGYGIAEIYAWAPERRRRLLVWLGVGMFLAFLAIRLTNVYGDPRAWAPQGDATKTLMSFFDVQKYPPSLLFLLVTLSPSLLALGLLDGRTLASGLGGAVATFGRVPLFFYFLQWIAAHVAGMAVTAAQGKDVSLYFLNFVQLFSLPEPPDMGGPLRVTYACWISATLLLYLPCRWYAGLKGRRRDWWLSYL